MGDETRNSALRGRDASLFNEAVMRCIDRRRIFGAATQGCQLPYSSYRMPPERLMGPTNLKCGPWVLGQHARTWAAAPPARAWRVVSWRNGTQPAWRARFCATRVTPAHDWRERRLALGVWLLCARALGGGDRTKYYLVLLPATASLRTLVRLTHQRSAVEQQDQELKDALGLDHFEGRTLPGWHRHVVLTALAYAWLHTERRRQGHRAPTLAVVRAVITEIPTAHFFVTRLHLPADHADTVRH